MNCETCGRELELTEVLPWHFLEGLAMIKPVGAEIRRGLVRNTRQKHDRCGKPLGDKRFHVLISNVTQFRYDPVIFYLHYELF